VSLNVGDVSLNTGDVSLNIGEVLRSMRNTKIFRALLPGIDVCIVAMAMNGPGLAQLGMQCLLETVQFLT
jgi:hypothetical protein